MSTRVVEVPPERLDGWLARFEANNPGGAPQRVVGVERFDHSPLAVILVRRGGYAVALASADVLLAHKVGSRHVQSRTAAGGWSQQRFARRRGNQADALVEAVQDHLVRILDGQPAPAALVVGGDKTLAADVLRDPRLRHLTALPARTAYAIADPKRAVLDDTLRRARNVHVTIHELT
ncbi:MAG: hypothetical protein LCH66_03935 [Actinobacteria bacterium]|jgi:hypothetical protein|nr:hypothetical protein [Actinomycetota bacterium]